MQLLLSEPRGVDDEDVETLELTLVPGAEVEVPGASTTTSGASTGAEDTAGSASAATTPTPTQQLFAALSTCADLNPDRDEDEGQGGDDYPAPGTGGWITADNMHEFADAEGGFAGFGGIPVLGGEVPAVAGTVRPREEDDEDGGEAGDAAESDETKWRRTE